MKKIIILIVLFGVTSCTQTPNWTSVKETNINVVNADPLGVDIFTNGYGNHIIVQESNSLQYYKMGVNGVAGTPIPLESAHVISPSISGDETRIYVVYRKSNENFIRTKFSGDGGLSWSYISNLNYNAGSIESVFSNKKLHVTYAVSNVIYYSSYNTEEPGWSTQTTVSTGETGYTPRITAYNYGGNDLVYFMYNKANTDICKWRKYNVTTNSWGTLYPVTIENFDIDFFSGFRVDNLNVVIYFQWHEQDPFQYYFSWVVRDLNNNYIRYGNADLDVENYRMYSAPTANGKTNTVLYFEQLGGSKSYSDIGLWRSNSNEESPTDQFYEYESAQIDVIKHLNLSSSGNEVHVIWKDSYGNNFGKNLRYIYDDQAPLTPTNFTGTTSNNHPKLTWSLNNGPDTDYEIWRQIIPYDYSLLTTVDNTTSSFTDFDIILGGTPNGLVFYKIRAKDRHLPDPYYSSFTNFIKYTYSGINKISSGTDTESFELSGNYPNPFNPSTTITFSIPEKSFVTLKVYDMLGREIAELVNEELQTGTFEKTFDASSLSSGVYIYRISAMKEGKILFSESKQMLLIK